VAHYPSYPPLHDDRTLRSLRRLVLIIAALLATACATDLPHAPDDSSPAMGNPAPRAAVASGSTEVQALSPAELEALKEQVRASGGRVIVQVRPLQGPRLTAQGRSNMSDQAVAVIQARLGQLGLRNSSRVQLVPLVFGEAGDAEIDALLADPGVLAVEPDLAMPLAERRGGSMLAESTPWGIQRVTAPAAWALQTPALAGTGVRVAFLDSGGDVNHPDLAWAGGYNAITGSTAPAAWHDDLSVCGGHGTHVAGTIGALQNGAGVVGVAPGVSLYAIKVFENVSGSCLAYVSKQVAGLNWAVQQGVKVVSISIGGSTYVSSYDQAITAATAAGTWVVAAAGNNGTTNITYPGRYPDALAIAALTASNTKSSYSNYGPKIFIAAPGDGILSTLPGGGYGSKSGTSMATPHAAGVIALLLAHNPSASRSQLLAQLEAGALDLGVAGRDDQTGWGLVRAYESITSGAAPTPAPLALALSPTSRRVQVAEGSTAVVADSANVILSGENSGGTVWTASKRRAWTTLTTAAGTGSGRLRWTRNPTGLAAGTWVDTITVSAGTLSARVVDTLIVAAPKRKGPPNGKGTGKPK
jgi:subtilisin